MKSKTVAFLLALTLLAPHISLAQERGFVSSFFCTVFSVFTGNDCSGDVVDSSSVEPTADAPAGVQQFEAQIPSTQGYPSIGGPQAVSVGSPSSGVSVPSLSRSDVQSMIDGALAGLPVAPTQPAEVRTVETVVYRSSSAQGDSIVQSSARALASLRADIEAGRVSVPAGSIVGDFVSSAVDVLTAVTGSFTSLFADNLTATNATSTNLVSLTAPVAPSFVATSTTATSTFAGNVSIGGALELSQGLSIASGGTGGTNASTSRSNLGLAYAGSGDIIRNLTIATWGDSLTAGAGGTSYPTQLASLSGYTVFNGGVGGQTSTQIAARMVASSSSHVLPTIIWAGRNNYTDPTTVKSDIAAMVSSLGHSNFIVLSVINGSYGGYEVPGGDGYNLITTLNSDLAALYPDNYLDVRAYLVSQYNPAIPQDVTDHANDTPPTSLRSDALHLNSAGYLKVAQYIYQNIHLLQSATQKVLTTRNVTELFASPLVIGSVTPNVGRFSGLSIGSSYSTTTIPTDGLAVQGNTSVGLTGLNGTLSVYRNASSYATNLNDTNSRSAFTVRASTAGSEQLTISRILGGIAVQGVDSAGAVTYPISLNPYGGNVTIGTTTAVAKLHISDTGNSSQLVLHSTSAVANSRYWGLNAQVNGGFSINSNTDAMATTTRFMITSAGNVGIGTTTPVSKLEVITGALGSSVAVNVPGGNDPDLRLYRTTGTGDFYVTSIGTSGGTGIFSIGNGNTTGGGAKGTETITSRLTILPNGSVGIGTTTPGSALVVAGDTRVTGSATVGSNIFATGGSLYLQSTGAGLFLPGNGAVAGNNGMINLSAAGTNQNITLTPSGTGNTILNGSVGIGTVSPVAKFELSVSGTLTPALSPSTAAVFRNNLISTSSVESTFLAGSQGTSTVSFGDYLTQQKGFVSYSNSTNAMTFGTSQGARMIIDSSGSVGIGTTSPTAQLTNTGTVRFGALGSAGASLVTDSVGNVTVSSDERLKDVVSPFSRGLAEVLGLEPITYRWNALSGLETDGLYSGFSAQDVRDSIPEAVGTDSRGYLTLSDRPILAAVVNAVRELSAKVDSLVSSNFVYVNTVRTNELCIEDVCINKQQLLDIIGRSGASYTVSAPSVVPEVIEPDTVSEDIVTETVVSTTTEEIIPDQADAGDEAITEGSENEPVEAESSATTDLTL